MRFKAKKRYGDYKVLGCPFCSRQATQKNEQGLDVCFQHTKQNMEEFKCTCGKWLEVRSGKFGPYFNCMDCGNINYQKGMEMKGMTKEVAPISSEVDIKKDIPKKIEKSFARKKEITITSNDVEYFD